MAKRHYGQANGDYELLRAFQGVVEAIEGSGLWVETRILPSFQLGVLDIWIAVFTAPVGNRARRRVVSFQVSWPNVQPRSFTAQLFQAATSTATLVDAWRAERGLEVEAPEA